MSSPEQTQPQATPQPASLAPGTLRSSPPTAQTPERILLIRLGGFGDIIFTLPAVHLVRESFPKARITFLVYKEFASLLEGFPGLNAVLTLDRARYRNPLTVLGETGSLLGGLARGRFSMTIDFQGFGETAVLSWLTRAPQRWGSVYRSGRKWAYTRGVARDPRLHAVDYHLDLLRQAGGLSPAAVHNEFIPPEKDMNEARAFFAQHQLDARRPTLFIQPFTSSETKSWPLERFIATAKLWQNRGLQILFGGGPGERQALAPAQAAGFAVAAGAPPLLSAGLVKLSTLVLGGDTGLLHLAVAMGKRVVMIMRYANPGTCIPFGHPDWVVLPEQPHAHVATVTAEAVEHACRHALSELHVRP